MNDFKKISSIFENFYKITGARISLHDTDQNEIFAYPETNLLFCKNAQKSRAVCKKCAECDKLAFENAKKSGESYTYTCHLGLSETVAPVYNFGVLSGFIMMGQITDKEARSKQEIRKKSGKYFLSEKELDEAITKIPEISGELISAHVNILIVIAEFLTRSNLVSARSKDRAQNIMNFISAHFTENLSVNKIAEKHDCSRATAMNCFKSEYGITINDFLIKKKIEYSKNLLLNSSDSIKTIAALCGYDDQNYFSRLFKEKEGVTPGEYRNKIRDND